MTKTEHEALPAPDAVARAPGIEATRDTVEEYLDGRAVVSLKREAVTTIAFARGSAAERPILEGGFGLLVVGGGSWLAWRAGLAVWDGVRGNAMPLMSGGAVIAVVFGLGALARALRTTDVLRIGLRDGSQRKLSFDAPLTPSMKDRFTSELRALGWNVE